MEENITVIAKACFSCTLFQVRSKEGTLYSSLKAQAEYTSDKLEYIPEFKDKGVLYITDFETKSQYRNKGYARYLLKYVIDFYKNNDKFHYDMLHLNACPYQIISGEPIYEAPENGLQPDKLLDFYKSFGLEIYNEYNITDEEKAFIMIMNL